MAGSHFWVWGAVRCGYQVPFIYLSLSSSFHRSFEGRLEKEVLRTKQTMEWNGMDDRTRPLFSLSIYSLYLDTNKRLGNSLPSITKGFFVLEFEVFSLFIAISPSRR